MAGALTYNTFGRTFGRFDWLHPEKKQVQYYFLLRGDAPEELKRWYTIPPEYDPEFSPNEYTALEMARELLCVLQSLSDTQQANLEALIHYLESVEADDRREWLRHQIERAEQKAAHWARRAERYREQLAKLEASVGAGAETAANS